jgi:hypothetical protein
MLLNIHDCHDSSGAASAENTKTDKSFGWNDDGGWPPILSNPELNNFAGYVFVYNKSNALIQTARVSGSSA